MFHTPDQGTGCQFVELGLEGPVDPTEFKSIRRSVSQVETTLRLHFASAIFDVT